MTEWVAWARTDKVGGLARTGSREGWATRMEGNFYPCFLSQTSGHWWKPKVWG